MSCIRRNINIEIENYECKEHNNAFIPVGHMKYRQI